jgi:glycosyltransferase involved in cell wall biosynthesis
MYELARNWVEDGAQVTVITSPYYKSDIKASGFISHQLVDGIRLIVIDSADSNLHSKIRRIFNALTFSIVSSWFAIRIPAKTVIASSGPITVGIPAILASLCSSKKMVFEVRDLWPMGAIEMGLIKNKILIRLGLFFEKLCYRRSQFVVPCSIGMEADIRARHPDTKMLVIPNASDSSFFGEAVSLSSLPEWASNPDNILFVYFGSLGAMDACEEIIYGFNLVKYTSRIHIAFIGDGSDKINLIEKTDSLGLSQNIHFMPLMSKKELRAWLKIARASFVVFKSYPVLATSSPNKLFDSLAAGVPVIQNTAGWMMDLVNDYGIGLNVESANPRSMADAITRFSDISQSDWVKMSDSALRLARNKFDRERLAKVYLSNLVEIQ